MGINFFTNLYKPWELVYYEVYKDIRDAKERERKLKYHGNGIRLLKQRLIYSLKNSAGFSLIEVIIFIGILSLFFVTGMVVVTASLRNMKVSEHKVIASQYAKQLVSWITVQKESDWISFVDNYTSASPGKTYCFNNETIAWPDPNIAAPCTNYSLGDPAIYKREATLTNSGTPTSQVEINITVEWIDAGNTFSVPLNTVLSRWE